MPRLVLILVALGALVFAAFAGVYFFGESTDQASFRLLNEDEIARRALDPEASGEIQKERALSITNASGPSIKVSSPSGFSLRSPVDFDINIEPRDGVPVDMQTLSIEYKIGPAWLNLTRRVMGQASIQGSRVFARGAELPPGNHKLRVSVKDQENRATRAVFTFSVAK